MVGLPEQREYRPKFCRACVPLNSSHVEQHLPLSAEVPAQDMVDCKVVTPQRTQALYRALNAARLVDKHLTEAEHVVGNFRKSLRSSSHGEVALSYRHSALQQNISNPYFADSCREVVTVKGAPAGCFRGLSLG